MKFETEEQAQEAIEAVAAWFSAQVAQHRLTHPKGEPPCADFARELAVELLDAAECSGLGGCSLCQG